MPTGENEYSSVGVISPGDEPLKGELGLNGDLILRESGLTWRWIELESELLKALGCSEPPRFEDESPLSEDEDDTGGEGAFEEQDSSPPWGRECHFSNSSPELVDWTQRG